MTTEAKWTPGPWELSGATHVYAPGPSGANICSVSEPRATTLVGYTALELDSPGFMEAVANARLIVAAPDLYAACVLALDFAEEEWTNRREAGLTDYEAAAKVVVDALRAAIAKAEGRTP